MELKTNVDFSRADENEPSSQVDLRPDSFFGRLRGFAHYMWNGPPSLPRSVQLEWRFAAIRWLAILFVVPALVLLTLPAQTLVLAFGIIALAIAYNLALQLTLPKYPDVYSSGFITTGCDAVLNIMMVVATGGFDGPFYYVLYTVTISAAMRYGYGPAVAVAAAFITADLIESLVQGVWPSSAYVFRSGFLLINSVLAGYLREQAHKAQNELERAKEEAEAANAAKTQFLASISHEIRTPMNIILGMGDLLAQTPLNTRQQEYVRTSRLAGDTMMALIGAVLDISRIEAGKFSFESVEFDLEQLVGDTTEPFAVRAREKGLDLYCFVAPEVPRTLVGDPTRLRQLITNFLGNAVKFTDAGEVVVRVHRDEASPGHLRFEIADTGIGIAKDQAETIFEPFRQADGSISQRYGGTGLGLAISKKLVDGMGGHIGVESTLGEGSVFHFTLPFELDTNPQPEIPPVPDVSHVLVVDSRETSRQILRQTLEPLGLHVDTAASAQEAISAATKSAGNEEGFGAYVIASQLVDGDGFELGGRLRKELTAPTRMVMVVSPGSLRAGAEKCNRLGLDGCVAHPLRRSELFSALRGDRVRTEDLQEETPVERLHRATPIHILLADDVEDNRFLIASFLTAGQDDTPFDITEAANGREAYEKFTAGEYDLILMDLQMPVLDGFGAIELMRDWERTKAAPPTPIVALTASAILETERKCIAAGFSGWLTKPVTKAQLIEAIHHYVPGTEVVPTEDEPAGQTSDSASEILDGFPGGPEVFKQAAAILIKTAGERLETLREALHRDDCARIAEVAHSLKGSFSLFNAEHLTMLAKQLEEQGRNDDVEKVKATGENLAQETEHFVEELKDLLKA